MRQSVGFSGAPPSPLTTTSTSLPSHSAWHSPVPYLFGGLAAMLGLIAFALLILACSYWKLSGYLDGGEEAGDSENGRDNGANVPCFEQRIVVIMAGDEKPTFLAMPISSRALSFGGKVGGNCNSDGGDRSSNGDGGGEGKKVESCVEGVEFSGPMIEEGQRSGNDQNIHGLEH